jgi:hypothetical protein
VRAGAELLTTCTSMSACSGWPTSRVGVVTSVVRLEVGWTRFPKATDA